MPVLINPVALGALIASKRKTGVTQKDLATAAGISPQLFSDLVRGWRAGSRRETRERVAGALGVKVEVIEMHVTEGP